MPLYEYECLACGKHTEKIQKFSDAEITVCPSCGGMLKRVITAPAFSFQGGGWYKDGYGNAAPPAKSEGSGDGGAAKAESGGESAPAGGAAAPAGGAAPAVTAAPVAAPAPAAPAASSDKK